MALHGAVRGTSAPPAQPQMTRRPRTMRSPRKRCSIYPSCAVAYAPPRLGRLGHVRTPSAPGPRAPPRASPRRLRPPRCCSVYMRWCESVASGVAFWDSRPGRRSETRSTVNIVPGRIWPNSVEPRPTSNMSPDLLWPNSADSCPASTNFGQLVLNSARFGPNLA